jgi:hypothetical protein
MSCSGRRQYSGSMSSKKTLTPSRSSRRVSIRPTASAAKSSRSAVAKLAPKKGDKVAAVKSVSQRVLAKVKTKTGMAVAAGVVLAAGVGLYRKYHAAH